MCLALFILQRVATRMPPIGTGEEQQGFEVKKRLRVFLIVFLFSAFVMKAVGEFVHEIMGHGFFVLLFGGQITSVHISLLWPYELSHIEFSGFFDSWQLTWIQGGGILVCLAASFLLQTLLLVGKVADWRLKTLLFWLSLWTFINPAGYLIIGGIQPFGDIMKLIDYGILSQTTSIAVGLVIFLTSFLFLSKIFRGLVQNTGVLTSLRHVSISLAILWLIIPLVTVMAIAGLGFLSSNAFLFFSLSFIPSVVTLLLPKIQRVLNKQQRRLSAS